MTVTDPASIDEISTDDLKKAVLRALARGWSKGHVKQATALDALLDGKKVAQAARIARLNPETCRTMWKRFQTFVAREEQRKMARKIVPLAADDDGRETIE